MQWSTPLPDGEVVDFDVNSVHDGIEIANVSWTRGGVVVEYGNSDLIGVSNTLGEITPLSIDRLTGSLVGGGLDRDTAISRAADLVRMIEASGANPVSTNGIRFAVGEMATSTV